MAGSRDPNANPGRIKVVPLVEIILCLCGLAMCSLMLEDFLVGSMKGRVLEGKFETWLPKDKVQQSEAAPDTPTEEIRVALLWDEASRTTIRKFGNATVRDDTQLQNLIRYRYSGWVHCGKPEIPAVVVDAAEMVPWQDVMCVVNLAKREKIERIEFAGRK